MSFRVFEIVVKKRKCGEKRKLFVCFKKYFRKNNYFNCKICLILFFFNLDFIRTIPIFAYYYDTFMFPESNN